MTSTSHLIIGLICFHVAQPHWAFYLTLDCCHDEKRGFYDSKNNRQRNPEPEDCQLEWNSRHTTHIGRQLTEFSTVTHMSTRVEGFSAALAQRIVGRISQRPTAQVRPTALSPGLELVAIRYSAH
ncbi:hypothetical protein B0H67DRAFT_23981 [Lasiosphaeris hirsuta]|uniref:Secreted protein n=1 Tax=Lasiosphaeris hirsuta TaxID=260670 RepID=A0AA40E6K2_9PEZI|nr:hypothetical protein B0H67DRAFT_23981 [Lasiosphaeris hirsuta]